MSPPIQHFYWSPLPSPSRTCSSARSAASTARSSLSRARRARAAAGSADGAAAAAALGAALGVAAAPSASPSSFSEVFAAAASVAAAGASSPPAASGEGEGAVAEALGAAAAAFAASRVFLSKASFSASYLQTGGVNERGGSRGWTRKGAGRREPACRRSLLAHGPPHVHVRRLLAALQWGGRRGRGLHAADRVTFAREAVRPP